MSFNVQFSNNRKNKVSLVLSKKLGPPNVERNPFKYNLKRSATVRLNFNTHVI